MLGVPDPNRSHCPHSVPLRETLLFVPANNTKLVKSAAKHDVAHVILDLEDGVAPSKKREARQLMASAVMLLKDAGISPIIRINHEKDHITDDLEAVVKAGVSYLMLPKTRHVDEVDRVSSDLYEIERHARVVRGTTEIIALIETPDALPHLHSIAGYRDRLIALAFGSEDFSNQCQFEPTLKNLFAPFQALLFSARAHGLQVIGLPGSIAMYGEGSGFYDLVLEAKQMGSDGVMCIHPDQVKDVRRVFTPTPDELASAKRIVDAFDRAIKSGVGVIELCGQMIDRPIAEKYRTFLSRASRPSDKHR